MDRDAVDTILQSMSENAPTVHRLFFAVPPSILCASVVELLLLYDLPKQTSSSKFEPMLASIKGTAGCLGVAAGLAAEDDDGDESGNSFLLIAGWESMGANKNALKSERLSELGNGEAKAMLHLVRFHKAAD